MTTKQIIVDFSGESPVQGQADYIAPETPTFVPNKIKIRQCIIGMKNADWITPAEARAWAERNALPSFINALIEHLPEGQQDDAYITALTMTEVERNNPLIEAAATILLPDATPAERTQAIDAFFISWAQINGAPANG